MPQSLSATNRGANGVAVSALFNVGNADALDPRFAAFNEIAGPNPGGFDFGLGSSLAGACSRPSKGRARQAVRVPTLRIERQMTQAPAGARRAIAGCGAASRPRRSPICCRHIA